MSTINSLVKIRRSGSPGSIPSELAVGELAINYADGRLFFDQDGVIKNFIDSDLIQTELSNYLPLSGGTLTGTLTLAANPTDDLQAATKAYVDAEVANAGVDDFPTGDYGLVTDANEFDAFGVAIFLSFDTKTTPVGSETITDLGSDSSI